MPKPLPFETFLRRAIEIHRDRYDYTQASTLQVDTHSKIPIVCPDHGAFEQLPYNHLQGVGCPRCGDARMGAGRRLSLEEIAERLRERGLFYDLVPGTYRSVNAPATWRCARHNRVFSRTLAYLLRPGPLGCPLCRDQARRERFAAERRHPDAEAHLVRIVQVLGPESAELYRRWLAGELLSEIARERGVTREAERLRLRRAVAVIASELD